MADLRRPPRRRWAPWTTTARRPEEQSFPSATQLLSWINSSPVGWVLLAPGDRVRHLNTRAGRILGLKAGRHLEGRTLADLCPDANLLSSVAMARRQDRPQRLEWHFDHQDFDVMVVPAADGWIGVQLQSRRSLEAQLEQQERWVSDVAHELKTPLTALLLVGDSLAAQADERNARLVERLQRELLRLQELVNDLLELSRLENTVPGRGLQRTPVDLRALVDQVWAGLRPLAEQRGVGLAVQDDDAITLQADASRLHRALLNLIDNAVRYSPDGSSVEVSITSHAGWCQVSVRDHGPGLSREDLQHMFERFYRGDPSRVRSQRTGSGLGLSIVQQIAVTHGGRIQASNHPEGGALMDLLLPTVGLAA
ncbi:cell wall metabolism sensor histidine kinase WalK [Cyanobium sp. CH-040]|uniref:sensor histidine kinase n=1 Tax=Cyanobium sp. CH-040 TaxID=2823708 RepID=UPI0020CFA161|nr:HAMP domain-containing sensor histidine kinase [Cyanobium sp. CH-040]